MRLNSLIPNFSARTTMGPIQFYDWQGDSYVFFNNVVYIASFVHVSLSKLINEFHYISLGIVCVICVDGSF